MSRTTKLVGRGKRAHGVIRMSSVSLCPTEHNLYIHLFQLGPNSGLHIIIFDEIDAICKARGSTGSNTGVHDTVVNQLLAKIDGVEQLNNILVIGMTNRRDMIDEALMRPGRLEV